MQPLTISVDERVAQRLRATGNASAYIRDLVADAGRRWRVAMLTVHNCGWSAAELRAVLAANTYGMQLLPGIVAMAAAECGEDRAEEMAGQVTASTVLYDALAVLLVETSRNEELGRVLDARVAKQS